MMLAISAFSPTNIRQGTLFTLASVVFFTNFQRTNPFADMMPPWTHFFIHPISFWQTWIEILRLNTARMTAETQEKRTQKVEDVQKRAEYRKAHGLDKDEGFGGWTAKTDKELIGPAIPLGDATGKEGEPAEEQVAGGKKPPVRKWLGIW